MAPNMLAGACLLFDLVSFPVLPPAACRHQVYKNEGIATLMRLALQAASPTVLVMAIELLAKCAGGQPDCAVDYCEHCGGAGMVCATQWMHVAAGRRLELGCLEEDCSSQLALACATPQAAQHALHALSHEGACCAPARSTQRPLTTPRRSLPDSVQRTSQGQQSCCPSRACSCTSSCWPTTVLREGV